MMVMPAALPLFPFDTVDNVNETEGRTLNIATGGGGNEKDKAVEEPAKVAGSKQSNHTTPFDPTIFYQRTREPTFDDIPNSSNFFDIHDRSRNQ